MNAPPRQIKLWSAGVLQTEYGEFKLTPAVLRSVYANYAKRKRKIAFDVEHLSSSSSADPSHRIAPGLCDLELRNGDKDIWLTDVEWSPKFGPQVARGEWAFLSPTFSIERNEAGEIIGIDISRIALTNDPATWGASKILDVSLSRKPLVYRAKGVKLNMDENEKTELAESPASNGLEAVIAQIDSVLGSTLADDVRTILESVKKTLAEMSAPSPSEVQFEELSRVLKTHLGTVNPAQVEGRIVTALNAASAARELIPQAKANAELNAKRAREALIEQAIATGKVSKSNTVMLGKLNAMSLEALKEFSDQSESFFAAQTPAESVTLSNAVIQPASQSAKTITIHGKTMNVIETRKL